MFNLWRGAVRAILKRLKPSIKGQSDMLIDLASANKSLFGMVATKHELLATGVTVHYSADRDVARTVASLVKSGLGYHFLIARDGTIFQLASTGLAVWHAGRAEWNGQSPNSRHIAICLMSWGKLTTKDGVIKNWAGGSIDPPSVRTDLDGTTWDAATVVQEGVLLKLLRVFTHEGIHPSNFCGHDEAAIPKGRKSDPGGVLSRTMQEIRAELGGLTKTGEPFKLA